MKGQTLGAAIKLIVFAVITILLLVATIITAAVKDVAEAIGGFATEVFEIRDSAKKASEEHGTD